MQAGLYLETAGPSCSKLMMLLVNVSLKIQTLISNICQYFLLKQCEKLLQCKSFSHFFNKKYQCVWLQSHKTLNELVNNNDLTCYFELNILPSFYINC